MLEIDAHCLNFDEDHCFLAQKNESDSAMRVPRAYFEWENGNVGGVGPRPRSGGMRGPPGGKRRGVYRPAFVDLPRSKAKRRKTSID